MEANSVPAVFGVNKFLWSRIEDAGILDKANYGGLTPIIPSYEVPELKQAMDEQEGIQSFPYIVYTWYSNGYAENWFQPVDTVIYHIKATDGKKLRELLLLTLDTFKRYDDSAQAVNDFIYRSDLGPNYQRYDYKSIFAAASQASKAVMLDDEPTEATVTLRVAYTNSGDCIPLL